MLRKPNKVKSPSPFNYPSLSILFHERPSLRYIKILKKHQLQRENYTNNPHFTTVLPSRATSETQVKAPALRLKHLTPTTNQDAATVLTSALIYDR